MLKNEFEILNYVRKNGLQSYRHIGMNTNLSLGTVSNIVKKFLNLRYIVDRKITPLGLEALSPYQVKNAVILAAGPSSRFVPLSLEQPKGLFKVKGEVLIERQIKQLLSVGIDDITIVLGYKKEAFFYLKDKYNVKFIINTEFNKKNNIHSLYLAKEYLGSTYVCSCDDYFTINVFDKYEFQSFYASIFTDHKTKEMYVKTDAKNIITSMKKGLKRGDILLGHSYWNKEFSSSIIKLMETYVESGEYDSAFWETLVADHLKILPNLAIKKYDSETIFEFDYVEELRAFDAKYVSNTDSRIMANICMILKCNEDDIRGFKPIHEGLTNTSFIFEVNGKKYVYRQPGEGTDNIVNRRHEKIALEVAFKNKLDDTYIYMSELDGWKISTFIDNFKEPNYQSFEDSLKIIEILKKLHNIKAEEINWTFEPIDEALRLEKIIKEKTTIQMEDFDSLKNKILSLYEQIKNDGIDKCFCHNDTYKSNWMLTPTKTILIDWEYAGLADPAIDIGYYIVDAMYSFEEAEKILKAYCGEEYSKVRFHYLSYVAIIAYYWFVWALYRESCGSIIGDSLYNWYIMAKRYSKYVLQTFDLEKQKNISTYEFLLLNYLEKNDVTIEDRRKLSNILTFSETKLDETIDKCYRNQFISKSKNKIAITTNGLKALEPYRVKRAIIMAAGFGSRMAPVTFERPKPLIKVHGKRIIDTLLDSLIAKGIKEIYIVRGYKKEKFDELLIDYPFIKFIDNDEYNITNNISSIIKALPYLDNCYICEADFLISNPDIIEKYHYDSNYLGAKVIETDDWCFKSCDGVAKNYQKGNTNCYQAFGISYWNKNDSKKIRQYLPEIYKTSQGKQEFWEACIFNYYKDNFNVKIKECSKFDIVEIDNFDELLEIDSSYKKYQ